jgi:hypothetical protein
MIRRTFVLGIVLLGIVLLVGVADPVSAHDDFRIIGTLEKHQGSTISVKKNTGRVVAIRIDKQTGISQDKKKVDATALKVGQSVVVDAYGDREDDSLALEIRIVPAIRAGGE